MTSLPPPPKKASRRPRPTEPGDEHTPPRDEQAEEGELCASCGMCCDGTLYTHVVLTDDEALALGKRDGLELVVRDSQPAILHGCSQHGPRGCAVYQDRPSACARYHCALAWDLLEGAITLPEALAIVRESKALVENVTEYAPPAPGKPLAIATWVDPPPGLSDEGLLAWQRAKDWLTRYALGPLPK